MKVSELEETVDLLTEELEEVKQELNSLGEHHDLLQNELDIYKEENGASVNKRLDALEYQLKKLIDMSYKYDRNNDTLQIQARITRQVLEYGGPDALDATYDNMKKEIMQHVASKKLMFDPSILYESF